MIKTSDDINVHGSPTYSFVITRKTYSSISDKYKIIENASIVIDHGVVYIESFNDDGTARCIYIYNMSDIEEISYQQEDV